MDNLGARAARLDRRGFLAWASKRGLGITLGGMALPSILAACGDDDDGAVATTTTAAGKAGTKTVSEAEAQEQAQKIVGDVVDFSLVSDEWRGPFGFVTMRIHEGRVDGKNVYYIRTDASDETYAQDEKLIYVPKLRSLTGDGLSGAAYLVEGAEDQPAIFSSEPGRDDYTPAWTLHRVTWKGDRRPLSSVSDVQAAQSAGALEVERTDTVFNAGIVKWSQGELAVDRKRTSYLGDGMLLEPVDTGAMRATFKLNQCYPASRYFALDHSMAPMAEMTHTAFSPALQDGPSKAGATGRTNVFMNGLKGPGPMGFQPSAFDFDAGNPAWSPYWDHFVYVWKDNATPRVLQSQTAIHDARDAKELDEFPGSPDTNGQIFTVNCPVPVLAPPTFKPT